MTASLIALQATDQSLWHRRLDLLLESTGEGVFVVDLHGHCVFINRAGAEMIGMDAAAVLGRNMHQLTHHSHVDGRPYADEECPIFNAFRNGHSCRVDTEVFWRSNGSPFAVEYSSHPILEDGQVRGAVITFIDISERRRAADALRLAHDQLAKANDELERRVAERTRALTDALSQLRELSAHFNQVREDERTRIAREVHDELGSLLVGLKMDVNWLQRRLGEVPPVESGAGDALRLQMRCKCQNMGRLIETAVENVGRIITDLRPSILDHQGLWAALEWQAQEFAQAAEISLDFDMQVAPGLSLPEPTAMAVFRIFQEVLSNVGRHARATRLSVAIRLAHARLLLVVRDNGVGAAAQSLEAPTAYGVLGMRERARQMGGSLSIDSAPGQGTCLTLDIPLQLP
ncbi:PAS domain S-box protein [Acidovorax lacteus]|uniref:histidine kinase n=1 Tax=Acidovorax lacteus TaxID=1924988 RepID=A0ABP8LAT2_9BURK